jgi:DNA-binding transcriptional LysR family regulator
MDWSDRIGRRIRLRDLHVVLAVAEEGSMAKAATKLAISHPVISKTVADLERTLGVPLFDRNSRGVELTAFGKALLKCGTTVFDEMRRGLKQIEFLSDPTSGELAVGGPELVMAGILPAISEPFLQRFPGVQLRVVHADTATMQFSQLLTREVELLIGRVPRRPIEDDVVSEPLLEEPFVAIAAKDSEWARRRRIELSDLAGEFWVLPPYDSAPGALITELFHGCGVKPPEPRIVSLSIQLTITLIAGGSFVGLLPSSVARLSARRVGLKILPIKLPTNIRFSLEIITVRNRTPGPLARLFIEQARAVAKSLPA